MEQHSSRARTQARSSFDARVRAWLVTLPSANTRAAYQRDLSLYGAWMAAGGRTPMLATTAEIDEFRLHCEAVGAGAATVNRRLAALSSFYRHVSRGGVNPVDRAARPSVPSTSETIQLDDDQADSVWHAAVDLGHKTATIVGLVLLDGLKTNELLLLDVDHLVVSRRGIDALVRRRDHRERVSLDSRTAGAVRRYLAGRADGPLLLGDNPTRQRARLTRFGVDYIVKRAGAHAGLAAPLTVNTLRSTRTSILHRLT